MESQLKSENTSEEDNGNEHNCYHAHFGAGRLGLGLAIPVLTTVLTRPLALFQRSSSTCWTSLDRKRKLKLIVNDEIVTVFTHLHDGLTLTEAKRLLESGENLFVSSGRRDLIRAVLERTCSFSTAMGTGGYEQVLQCLGLIEQKAEHPYPIYLFENETNPTSPKFVETVEQLVADFKVVPVTADRSCISLQAYPDRLIVKCESHPGLVILQDDLENGIFKSVRGDRREEDQVSATRFASPEIIVTKSRAEQEFFTKRKLALVNGINNSFFRDH